METITVSLNLADILRKTIDDAAQFKRNADVPKEVFEAYLGGEPLSEEQIKQAEFYIYGLAVQLFLEGKEGLIIPDDAIHKLAKELLRNLNDTGITFAYQDFYGYQFTDKLDDIVRRAFKVRDVFAKNRPPSSLKVLCQEAYQSYLYGYHTASVALIRCIVESVLKDRLQVDTGELSKLNDLALDRNLYPKKIWHKINSIRKTANIFVHETCRGKTPSESNNLEVIGLAQEVLQALMGSSNVKDI
jgi:hypothetical protein